MTALEARLLHRGQAQLGESPLWDDDSGTVLWVDLSEGVVFSAAPKPGAPVRELYRAEPGQTVSAIVRRSRGGIAICLRRSIVLLDADGSQHGVIPVEGLAPGYRLSDACAGPNGELWVGVVADGEPINDSVEDLRGLYRVNAEGSTRVLAGIGFANGMGFTSGDTFHLVDSTARSITAYRYDSARETIDDIVDIIHTDPAFGLPDGMAIDSEGGLWVAFFDGGAVRRFLPGWGWSEKVDVGVAQVSSCTFVGDGLRQLAVTTARVELDDAELSARPLAGSLFVIKPGVRGRTREMCAL